MASEKVIKFLARMRSFKSAPRNVFSVFRGLQSAQTPNAAQYRQLAARYQTGPHLMTVVNRWEKERREEDHKPFAPLTCMTAALFVSCNGTDDSESSDEDANVEINPNPEYEGLPEEDSSEPTPSTSAEYEGLPEEDSSEPTPSTSHAEEASAVPAQKAVDTSAGSTRRKRGQKPCRRCGKVYSNNAIPRHCEQCNFDMGGRFVKSTKVMRAYKIAGSLFSVRTNIRGIGTRHFVKTDTNECFASPCETRRGSLSIADRPNFSCEHIREALKNSLQATKIEIKIDDSLVLPPKLSESLQGNSDNGIITIYELPNNNKVIPTFSEFTTFDIQTPFCHIKDGKCDVCQDSKRIHTLIGKTKNMCSHQILDTLGSSNYLGQREVGRKKPQSSVVILKEKSVNPVIAKIKEHFPTLENENEISNMLKKQLSAENELFNKSKFSCTETQCQSCSGKLENWSKGNQNGFLFTIGRLKNIEILPKYCVRCKVLSYPSLEEKGFVTLGNKFIIGFDVVIDTYNEIMNGGPLIKFLTRKLELLSKKNGVDLGLNRNNHVIRLEKSIIIVLSIMITGDSLDQVVCLLCGSFPKIVSTDGNSKDTTEIRPNQHFTSNEDPIESLEDFLSRLQVNAFASCFFQGVQPIRINLLKVPLIIAPRLLGKQVNTEAMKIPSTDKIDKDIDLHHLSDLIRSGQLEILNLEKHTLKDLKEFGREIGLKVGRESQTAIQERIKYCYKQIMAGNSNCHNYPNVQKRTGGWTDAWCEHLSKVGAKLQSRQESVRDPVDLLHSLKKLPVLHICDDACTVASHTFLRYPEESQETLGARRGCFTIPSHCTEADAATTPDVPDILPLFKTKTAPYPELMTDTESLKHPDTGNSNRYIMGHRLQMKSHKRKHCTYHVLDLTKSGRKVRSLTQEALQVRRKYRRVKQNRKRSFSVAYLYNYILDFSHNHEKYKAQYKELSEMNYRGRDPISWRGVTKPKQAKPKQTANPK